jgi:tripartite-type tricarboxylate transporter receptor subunit TctC
LILALITTTLAAWPAPALAAYPEKPLEIIVPSPPGGGTDIAFRLLAEVVEPKIGRAHV